MAKSTGNLVLISDLLRDYPAAAIRLLILDRPWDQDWDYDQSGLDAAVTRLEQLQAAAGRPDRETPGTGGGAVHAIGAALANDLDVPAALRIAEDQGGQAARVLGSLLGFW
jgi:cysteinyl-tRNA synthetase